MFGGNEAELYKEVEAEMGQPINQRRYATLSKHTLRSQSMLLC